MFGTQNMRHTKSQPLRRAKPGRKAAGHGGEKVSGYAQITLRLPAAPKSLLDAITAMTGLPAWRIVERALAAYVRELSTDEQRVLTLVRQHRAKRH